MKKGVLLMLLVGLLVGCKTKDVQPAPTITFSAIPRTYGQYGFSVNAANVTSYAWDFGDGGKSTEASPIHSYSANRNYTITVAGIGPGGTVTTTRTLVVADVPGACYFWSSDATYSIEVTLDSKVGKITKTFSTVPGCNIDGTAFFPLLSEGSHAFTATNNAKPLTTWKGTVLVIGGQCQAMQLTK